MKSGDVLIINESELVVEDAFTDLRAAKSAARERIENGSGDETLVILRVERVARPRPRRPAYDCAFDGDEGGEE